MRLRGLAHRLPDRTVMVFPRCRDVHTLTMGHPLDIAFIGEDGRVVRVHRFVLPGVRLRHREAVAVVERFARPGTWFLKGDVVRIPRRSGTAQRRLPEKAARRKRRKIWN